MTPSRTRARLAAVQALGQLLSAESDDPTARNRAWKGNQAEADFLLGAGIHRVSCTDAVTKKSIDVVLRVGPEERNETDCFPP